MNIQYQCCAGLDVHKKTVVACLLALEGTATNKQIRTFGTMTADLRALADWLASANCTHVAMESTGVYWKPIYNILEGSVELLVVNAQHYKAVPGRKTDIKDAEWLAELLQHGLLKPSFVPDKALRELRELTRYRQSLIHERTSTVNRLQKILEGANIKLASVAADILGVSGRAMLQGLLQEDADPAVLADLAKRQMRKKIDQLKLALEGRVGSHQRFMLATILAHIDYLDRSLAHLSSEVEQRLTPFNKLIDLLDSIPGINRRIAEVILAEIGTDLTRFPSAAHLASWAGMCPGNDESAGKQGNGRTRKGTTWLRQALTEAAHGASHKKNSYLAAQYQRLAGRRGKKKAVIAVAHSILVIIYHVLSKQEPFVELGPTHFTERNRERSEQRAVRLLAQLGYKVELLPLTKVAAADESPPPGAVA